LGAVRFLYNNENFKNMKNIILLIVAIVFTIQCSAQTKTVSITDKNDDRELETYYKDADNNLDAFVGTWIFTDGNTSLKIVLKKEIKRYDDRYYSDLLIGGYQYIEDGDEKINTLSRLDKPFTIRWDYEIVGNTILENHYKPECDDCLPNEKRARLYFYDPVNESGGSIIFRKITVDGQLALKAFKRTTGGVYMGDTAPRAMFVSDGEYILIKQ
jgi:hypothetical protein